MCCVAVAQDKEKATQVVEVKDIKLTVPKAWKQEEPSNQLRLTQFKLSAAEGDKDGTELAISQFGGGGGGRRRSCPLAQGKVPMARWASPRTTD